MTDHDYSKLPKERKSFWRETEKQMHFQPLEQNIEVDVAVAGGGMAGIVSAYMLAKEGKKIALLEAKEMLHGTTGYTTAKLSAQHNLIYDELINRYGQEKAKLFYQANMQAIAMIKDIVQEEQIDCNLMEQDAFVFTQKQDLVTKFRKEAEAYEKLGIPGKLISKLPVDLEIDAAIKMERQAQFQPASFLNGILEALEKMDVNIFEHTMVTGAEHENKIILQTDTGKTVSCKDVIFATHYPAVDPDNFYTSMRPEMSYALAFKTEQEYPDGMYINTDQTSRTFRKMTNGDEDYLLVGGQSHQIGDQHSELERYEDIRQFAEMIFGMSEPSFRWSSHDLITADRVPFIGQLHPQKPNMYTATGFSKWGLADAVTGAQLLRDLILNQKNPYSSLYYPRREIPEIREIEPGQVNVEEEELGEAQTAATSERLTRKQAAVIEKDDKKIGVYKDDNGKVYHLDLSCTHLGCDLNWNDGDRTWDCPCHGSRFTATGEVLEGPAKEPLAKADHE